MNTRTPGCGCQKKPDQGFQERDPQQHLRGNVFPAARQARAMTASVWWGDAGDVEHPQRGTMYRVGDPGRDTVADGGPRDQWDDAYGMSEARLSFRDRFLNTLNLGKLIRLQRNTVGNGQSDMRPTAAAVRQGTFGNITPPVSTKPGGRMVAPGRVTNWPMTSLLWKPMGSGDGSG